MCYSLPLAIKKGSIRLPLELYFLFGISHNAVWEQLMIMIMSIQGFVFLLSINTKQLLKWAMLLGLPLVRDLHNLRE